MKQNIILLFALFLMSFKISAQNSDQGLYFDGVDDMITISHSAAYDLGTGNFTVESWVRLNTVQPFASPSLFSNREFGLVNTGLQVYFSSGRVFVKLSGVSYFTPSGYDLRDSICHHVAVVRRDTTLSIYIDGTFNYSFTGVHESITSTNGFKVSKDDGGGNSPLKGKVHELRFWNISRTASQIMAAKDGFLTGSEPGLIGYWRMNDGSGQTVNDLSTANNDGYLGHASFIDSSDPVYQADGCMTVPITDEGMYFASDDYITIPINPAYTFGTGEITYEAIIKYDSSTAPTSRYILSRNTTSDNTMEMYIFNGSLSFLISNSGNSIVHVLGANSCHHVAITRSGAIVKLYADGGLIYTSNQANNSDTVNTSGGLKIGKAFGGAIREVRIWNVARTQAQLQAYKGMYLAGNEPNLVAYWRLNDGNVQTIDDLSATNNNAYKGSSNVADAQDPVEIAACSIMDCLSLPLATITPGGPLTFCTGGSVMLTANLGTGLTYQWLKNATNISGATTQNYTATQSGSYTVQVTNSTGCSSASAATVVTVNPLPIASISANGPTTFCSGSVVLTAFTVTGYTYQWQKNSANIPGATNSGYTASLAGSYRCIVTNACGNATSNTINVTVSPLTITISPTGFAIYCIGSSVLITSSGGTGYSWQWKKNGIAIAGATLQTYSANQAGSYTVTVTQGTCTATSPSVAVSAAQPLSPTITNYGIGSFCGSTLVNLNTLSIPDGIYQWLDDGYPIPNSNNTYLPAGHNGNYTVVVSDGCGMYASAPYSLTDFDIGWPYYPHYNVIAYTGSLSICATGGSVYLYNDNNTFYSAPSFQWYKNGVAIPSATNSGYIATTAGTYVCSVSDYSWWCGSGPPVFSNWLTVTTVAGINPAVSISAAGPTEWCGAGSVVLNASATNTSNYQWVKNYSNISGATTSSYTATSPGNYTCYVSNSCGNATSNGISVSSQTAPVPSIHASGSTTVCQPAYVFLYVTTGSGPHTYQWKKNGTNISSATNYNYYATVSGSYTVVTTNICSSATSGSIVVTVNTIPTVSISAAGSATFCSGGTVTLNALSTGTTYQWKKDGTGISGASLSSYAASEAGNYTCYVTNNCGNATSNSIAVTVNSLPSATITPAGPTTFCSGGNVTLNSPVAANRIYQWKKGANLISGATLSSYTATTGGSYRVIVTNTVTGCSKTTGSATIVTINTLPSATITPQGPTTFCAGGSVVLAAYTGAGLTYKWKKGSNFISGATLSNYTATIGGAYKVQVTNSNGCSKTSAGVVVSVPCKLSESENESESAFDVKVYPNPNSGEFTIKFSNRPTSLIQIELTDEIGKVVKRFETNDETLVIEEANLARGIYCLTARNKDEVVIKKINVVK